ncbi:MAG: TerB family tellurite resistance protein [Bacteroidota bacterium]|nr:TerB family tellurite resistance protein [Bacteroidota bacterium]
MGKFAKWIGGGLGFAFGGPIGGLLGFLFGAMVDSAEVVNLSTHGKTTQGDYAMSLLVLIAAVIKADGKIMRSELDFVKRFLVQNFGVDGAQEALAILKDLLKQEIPVQDVCGQIADHVDYSSRLQLLHFLFGLAYADGRMEPVEERLIEVIANSLGITEKDTESIRSMFKNTVEDLYKILEIDSTASNEDVKKAYRKMAVKYHPDKVAYLGEDVKNAANEKFQKLNSAYEKIKKERGMV